MNFHRISSPITKVLWAGWETDTRRLQENGWQISAEHDIYSLRYRFALKHPNFRMYGLTESVMFDQYYDNLTRYDNPFGELPFIQVKFMASRLEINIMDNLSKFEPIDTMPNFVTQERKSIEDFLIFRPIGKANEIIITPDINDLLNEIIKKQDPKQKEMREKKRKEWRQFCREINEANLIEYEKIEDNRDSIVAQLITI